MKRLILFLKCYALWQSYLIIELIKTCTKNNRQLVLGNASSCNRPVWCLSTILTTTTRRWLLLSPMLDLSSLFFRPAPGSTASFSKWTAAFLRTTKFAPSEIPLHLWGFSPQKSATSGSNDCRRYASCIFFAAGTNNQENRKPPNLVSF